MPSTGRAIQGLILFSCLWGVLFLWQVYDLLPPTAFEFVAAGWALFVVDGILTFMKQRASFILGFVLAIAALVASLGEPEHYVIAQSGNYLALLTLVLGAGAQALLILLVPYYLYRQRKKEWAWPGASSAP